MHKVPFFNHVSGLWTDQCLSPIEQYWHEIEKEIPSNLLPFPTSACFADEELPLDADGAAILSETFKILSLKEMKLQSISAGTAGPAGEEPEEENMANMAKAVIQAAQKKVVSQVRILAM